MTGRDVDHRDTRNARVPGITKAPEQPDAQRGVQVGMLMGQNRGDATGCKVVDDALLWSSGSSLFPGSPPVGDLGPARIRWNRRWAGARVGADGPRSDWAGTLDDHLKPCQGPFCWMSGPSCAPGLEMERSRHAWPGCKRTRNAERSWEGRHGIKDCWSRCEAAHGPPRPPRASAPVEPQQRELCIIIHLMPHLQRVHQTTAPIHAHSLRTNPLRAVRGPRDIVTGQWHPRFRPRGNCRSRRG